MSVHSRGKKMDSINKGINQEQLQNVPRELQYHDEADCSRRKSSGSALAGYEPLTLPTVSLPDQHHQVSYTQGWGIWKQLPPLLRHIPKRRPRSCQQQWGVPDCRSVEISRFGKGLVSTLLLTASSPSSAKTSPTSTELQKVLFRCCFHLILRTCEAGYCNFHNRKEEISRNGPLKAGEYGNRTRAWDFWFLVWAGICWTLAKRRLLLFQDRLLTTHKIHFLLTSMNHTCQTEDLSLSPMRQS